MIYERRFLYSMVMWMIVAGCSRSQPNSPAISSPATVRSPTTYTTAERIPMTEQEKCAAFADYCRARGLVLKKAEGAEKSWWITVHAPIEFDVTVDFMAFPPNSSESDVRKSLPHFALAFNYINGPARLVMSEPGLAFPNGIQDDALNLSGEVRRKVIEMFREYSPQGGH